MTHVKALQAGHSSQGTSEPIIPAPILDIRNSLFYRISGHFRSICNFIFLEFFLQNGCRRPFWMSEIHFRSHFWQFQIDTQLSFFFGNFWQNGCRRPFWMFTLDCISGHFRLIRIFNFFYKMATGGHFGCSKITFYCIYNHFRSIGHIGCPKFAFDSISGHFRSIRILIIFLNFGQNGRRRQFWMSENNFRSQLLPFQIDTQLFFLNLLTFWIGRQCQLSNSSEIFGWIMHVSSENVV